MKGCNNKKQNPPPEPMCYTPRCRHAMHFDCTGYVITMRGILLGDGCVRVCVCVGVCEIMRGRGIDSGT